MLDTKENFNFSQNNANVLSKKKVDISTSLSDTCISNVSRNAALTTPRVSFLSYTLPNRSFFIKKLPNSSPILLKKPFSNSHSKRDSTITQPNSISSKISSHNFLNKVVKYRKTKETNDDNLKYENQIFSRNALKIISTDKLLYIHIRNNNSKINSKKTNTFDKNKNILIKKDKNGKSVCSNIKNQLTKQINCKYYTSDESLKHIMHSSSNTSDSSVSVSVSVASASSTVFSASSSLSSYTGFLTPSNSNTDTSIFCLNDSHETAPSCKIDVNSKNKIKKGNLSNKDNCKSSLKKTKFSQNFNFFDKNNQKAIKGKVRPLYNGRIAEHKHYKTPRYMGIPKEEALKIKGTSIFLNSFINNQNTNNLSDMFKLTVLRQFFRFCYDKNFLPISFCLLYNVKAVEAFTHFICKSYNACAKTKLNKLYGLKFILNWMYNRSAFKEQEFYSSNNKKILQSLAFFIQNLCRNMTPQVKSEEKRATTRTFYEERNQYLTLDEFRNLGKKLLKELEKKYNFLKTLNNLNLYKDEIYSYEKTLFVSLFVLIPVQRLQLILNLRNKDIIFNQKSNTVSFHIGVEKNSYRKYSSTDKVGRFVFVPNVLSRFLYVWVLRFQIILLSQDHVFRRNNENLCIFINSYGTPFTSRMASKIIKQTTQKLTTKILGPLVLRKIRITHTLNLIKSMNIPNLDKCLYETQVAQLGGHTVEVMRDYYRLKDPDELIEETKKHTLTSNKHLFGDFVDQDNNFTIEANSLLCNPKEETHNMISSFNIIPKKNLEPNNIKNRGQILELLSPINKNYIIKPSNRIIRRPLPNLKKQININSNFDSDFNIVEKDVQKANSLTTSPIRNVEIKKNIIFCTSNVHCCSVFNRATFENTQVREKINEKELLKVKDSNFWLTSDHMLWACNILKKQFPNVNGLENTLVLEHLQIKSLAVQRKNFYIIFNGSNHWVAAATYCYSNYWYIYDSLNTITSNISMHVKKQLTQISGRERKFRSVNCASQVGSSDCGLYTVAYIVDLLNDKRPELSVYDQDKMRNHFIECVKNQAFIPFPSKKRLTYVIID